MQYNTIAEEARAKGISVSTLRRQIKQKEEQKKLDKAFWELVERGPGWNNRGGCKKRIGS